MAALAAAALAVCVADVGMAVGMAVEWSWAALGPYISDVLNVSAEQEPAITQAISVASRYFMSSPELLE